MTPDGLADVLPASVETSDGRQPRQKLRPWLIDQINKGDIPGLEWLDSEELKFKIPWKHFGRPKINVNEDSELFRRWAIHTGKFQEGDKWDISTWKTRMRCALHKLTDIEEVPELNQKGGNHPYRVYRLIRKEMKVERWSEREDMPYSSMDSGKVSSNAFSKECDYQSGKECDYQSGKRLDEQSGKNIGNESGKESLTLTSRSSCGSECLWMDPGENITLSLDPKSHNDKVVEFGDLDLGSIDLNLENILNELDTLKEQSENHKLDNPFSGTNLAQINTEVSLQQQNQYQEYQGDHQYHQHPYHHQEEYQKQPQQQQGLRQQLPMQQQQQQDMQEQLQKQQQTQQQQFEEDQFLLPMITTKQGVQVSNAAKFPFIEERVNSVEVKLYYKDEEIASHIVDNINGVRIALKLPPLIHEGIIPEGLMCYGPVNAEQILFPSTKDPYATKILSCMSRGLVLQFYEGQVLATRLCQAKVYYSDSEFSCIKELPRQRTVVVFDYNCDFMQKLQQYKLGDGERPSYERYFSFAQSWSTTSPLNKNYVRCTMIHCLSRMKFKEFENETPIDFKISSLNQLDELAHQIEDIHLQE